MWTRIFCWKTASLTRRVDHIITWNHMRWQVLYCFHSHWPPVSCWRSKRDIRWYNTLPHKRTDACLLFRWVSIGNAGLSPDWIFDPALLMVNFLWLFRVCVSVTEDITVSLNSWGITGFFTKNMYSTFVMASSWGGYMLVVPYVPVSATRDTHYFKYSTQYIIILNILFDLKIMTTAYPRLYSVER
jgi:hypothetical protein